MALFFIQASSREATAEKIESLKTSGIELQIGNITANDTMTYPPTTTIHEKIVTVGSRADLIQQINRPRSSTPFNRNVGINE